MDKIPPDSGSTADNSCNVLITDFPLICNMLYVMGNNPKCSLALERPPFRNSGALQRREVELNLRDNPAGKRLFSILSLSFISIFESLHFSRVERFHST
ncbi:unnamed protein product [Pleuronectes platessa]|uniref:Uncharacterized protein n=1 Tax=Pleuronectes platessa TaxID=8262 RepID=A0A9N7V2B1_PLEPL|nr:unnamed protein product [Pleuronectes platessa]